MKNFFKKLYEKHPTIAEIFRFLLVGGLATVIDYLVMALVCFLLGFTSFSKEAANVVGTGCGFCVGLLVNYVLSVLFVFEHKGKSKSAYGFFVFVLLSLVGLGIHLAGMYIGNSIWGLNEWLVKTFLTAVVLVYNYLSKRLLLFKKEKDEEEKK